MVGQCTARQYQVMYYLLTVFTAVTMLFAELWEGLVSKLQQERINIGLERIHLDNMSPFKLFGLSLVSMAVYLLLLMPCYSAGACSENNRAVTRY